jgi:hypothetical protein
VQAPASFEDAITEAASALKEAARNGKVAVVAGATVTNEEAYLAAAIAKQAFGTAADSSLGPVMRAVKAALEARIGTWKPAGDMSRLAKAKAIVVVADDLEESHNVASVRIKDAVADNGAELVVVGPLRSELVDFASTWVRPRPGDEGAAAAAIADAIAGGATQNDGIQRAAATLRDADRDATFVVCAPNPVDPALAASMAGGAANIAVALFGEAAAEHLVVLPAEVNVHGLLDRGVGLGGSANPLEGLAGLLLVRDDPTMRLPGATEALARIGTVVVVDNVAQPAAKGAAAVIAEGRAYASRGTYTQGDFRAQRLTPAVKPEGEAVPLFRALAALGAALGVELPADEDATLGVIAKEDPAYLPAWDLLVGEGVRLAVARPGVGRMAPVDGVGGGEGFSIITSRDLYTAADAASLRHPEADKLHRYDRIQLSEEDGARLGVRDGDGHALGRGRVDHGEGHGHGARAHGCGVRVVAAAGRGGGGATRGEPERHGERGSCGSPGAGGDSGRRLTRIGEDTRGPRQWRGPRGFRRVGCWRGTGETRRNVKWPAAAARWRGSPRRPSFDGSLRRARHRGSGGW